MKQKQILLPSIITSILLLIAIFPIKEYNYFVLLRWVVWFSAIFVGYVLFQEKRYSWVWLMGIIVVLFNPIESPSEKNDDAYSYFPKCKAQYKKGFDMCSDCKIELVNFRGDEELL